MKKIVLSALLTIIAIAVIGQKSSYQTALNNSSNVGAQLMRELSKTSPFLLNDERLALLYKIETYSDKSINTTFREYLNGTDQAAKNMEDTIPILYSYRLAFDKVLEEVKHTKVKKGTAKIWLLYNMGFVVKTPSGCFGIDINHRGAEQFEPYLDFLCITHKHGDHFNTKLMEAMHAHGKPVVSNFFTASEKYYSTTPASYKIGNFSIQTDISDHLLDPKLSEFVTIFRIQSGKDAGNFSLLHGGDTGFNPERFKKVQGPVSVAILRWGAERENNILGTGEGQVQTDYAILSHLIELGHLIYPKGQASITKTLEHLPNVKCKNTLLPFWGESMTWKKGKLQ